MEILLDENYNVDDEIDDNDVVVVVNVAIIIIIEMLNAFTQNRESNTRLVSRQLKSSFISNWISIRYPGENQLVSREKSS